MATHVTEQDINQTLPGTYPDPPPVDAEGPIHILTNRWLTVDPRFGRAPGTFVELDLGCGKGGLALAMAARFPDRLVLACDVMLGRLRKVANKARVAGLDNLEILRANSLDLVAYQLPPASVDRVHVLCPDPWPKKRHWPRRLVNPAFLWRVARILRPGGILHLSTDDPEYAEFMLAATDRIPVFRRDPEACGIADVADIETEFETRWRTCGIDVPHLVFTRLTEPSSP